MRSAIITAAALFTAALAAPNASLGKKFEARGAKCMSDDDAQQVATNFKDLIANYSDDLADAAMTTDFSDYSDSVNELINGGCPDGPATVCFERWKGNKEEDGLIQLTARLSNFLFS